MPVSNWLLSGLVSVVLGVLVLASSSPPPADPIQVGQPFPVVQLPEAETGEPFSIENFRGKKLVLHVWASW